MTAISDILGVFSDILTWFAESLSTVGGIFWNATDGLTFIGGITVIGVGIAVISMVIAMVRGLLRLQ